MDVLRECVVVLDAALGLNGRGAGLTSSSPLLGVVPELDSMAVVAVITALEDRFGLVVEDDEIDGEVFRTVGSLAEFVARKLQR